VTGLRRAALEVFGRLPAPLRRLVVRVLTPHYVMGAVLALRQGDEVLMLHARHVRFGWTLPGGLMRGGETPREALDRELREELRLEVDLDADATVVIVDPSERRVDFVFERHVTERPEVHVDGTEVLEARWLPLTSELCDDIARDALTRLATR
jgi:ADP-ribose pyrophosphatase YjhB (NUDIX family)